MPPTKTKCSLCSNDSQTAKKIVTGSSANICHECVATAKQNLIELSSTESKQICLFCDKDPATHKLSGTNRNTFHFCKTCIDLCYQIWLDEIYGEENTLYCSTKEKG